MDPQFWSSRKVLVTGHTGFKGAWLCLWLERLGAEVVGYALDPPTEPSLYELTRLEESIVSIHGDVRSIDDLSAVIRDHAPEVIFHLAAQSVVRQSYADPLETYSTNVMGTACLLEALRRTPGPRAVVNVTTDKCYKNKEWIWGYREIDELGGHDPYSNSKACSELVTQAFIDSFFPVSELTRHGIRIATARAGNVIGGGDWTPDQLVPDIIRAVTSGKTVRIRQPDSMRPWQHVLDCLSGYILLAESLSSNVGDMVAWNFGPSLADARTVSWVADFITRIWDDNANWVLDDSAHPHEARMLRLDSTRATKVLGWQPRLGLSEALHWTVDWYKSYYENRQSPSSICHRQIDDYTALTVGPRQDS